MIPFRSPGARIRQSIARAADRAGHTLDSHQEAVADALAEFGAGLPADRSAGWQGLYVWGTVGRGKTWLADAFFDAVEVESKRRVHFHSFYRQLQLDLYRNGIPQPGAIDTAIDELVDGVDLLYFDEFHLHDAGDATLALRVLRDLETRRVPLLATSNYPPSGLLPDEMFHHLFEPGIDLIERNLTVVAVDGATDYRRVERADDRRHGFSQGSWQRSAPEPTPEPEELQALTSGGRTFTARRADATQLWFTFADLCEAPTSAGDYLSWAERWNDWVIEAVPRLTTCSPQARQRFLNLVDVLNDRGIRTTFVSDLTPEQVLEGGPKPTVRGAAADREEMGLGLDGLPIDVARTASRLALLRREG
ncbi:cell division protein ZapE [Homoserinimonas hongtaonis]|uniref:cell division protein ZapE n=1 Tax=Homoserinimonas hongtaonis TaxID=2079791 RepID=UPI000D3C10EA|nr:cell division protein ZapE [Salinibacterium hongtaonis]AWB89553.1 cell division protein ZapE [Salinibacterium hongtaonis]